MKKFLQAIQQGSLAIPPLWLMRQAGRYLPEYRQTRAQAGNFLNLCYSPELATEVTLQPLRRYNFDAAILFSDILVVPQALGFKLDFQEGEGPILEKVEMAKLDNIDFNAFHQKLAPVYQTVGNLSREIPASTTLIGFCGAPWTVATYMTEGGSSRDFTEAKKWAYGKEKDFARIIDLLVEASSQYLLKQVENGAEVLQIFDSWAGVLPEPQFYRWVIEPTSKIVKNIKTKYPNVPIIGFPKGAGSLYLDYAQNTGVDVLSLDSSISLKWAKEKLQPLLCLQGNLDPVMLLTGGETMLKEIDRIISILKDGRFIFNLGHGILPATPPENVEILVKRVRNGA